MWYTIKVNMDNAAFCDTPTSELVDILHKAVHRIDRNGYEEGFKLFDTNGNEVGYAKETED